MYDLGENYQRGVENTNISMYKGVQTRHWKNSVIKDCSTCGKMDLESKVQLTDDKVCCIFAVPSVKAKNGSLGDTGKH